MKNSLLSLLLALGLVSSVPTYAQQAEPEEELISGSDLLQMCDTDSGDRAQCHGFITSLVQMVTMLQEMDSTSPRVFCIDPELVSIEQVRLHLLKWIGDRPERQQEAAFILTGQALNEAWPCTSGSSF